MRRPTLYARAQRVYEKNFAVCYVPSFLANQSHALGHWCIKIGARSDSSESIRQGNAKMSWRQRKKERQLEIYKVMKRFPFPLSNR
jgi:hypothetical protein